MHLCTVQAAGSKHEVWSIMSDACSLGTSARDADYKACMLCRLGAELDISPWQKCWPHDSTAPLPAQLDGLGEDSSLQQEFSTSDLAAADAGGSMTGLPDSCTDPGASPEPTAQTTADKAPHSISSSSGNESVSDPAMTCPQTIKEIRRTRFGIGIEFNDQTAQYRQEQEAMLAQATQALSTGLYCDNSHFILELLQNADDANFAPEVAATLEFVLEENCITVFNNEVSILSLHSQQVCLHCRHHCLQCCDVQH